MSGVNCREFESALIEVARNGPLDRDERARVAAHLEACSECRRVMHGQKRLSAAAGSLAAENARFSMPPRVEHALLAEFESANRPQPRRLVYVLGGAIAASLALVSWVVYRPAPKVVLKIDRPVAMVASTAVHTAESVSPETEPRIRKHKRTVPPAEPEPPFIAIPYTLPVESWERTDVVRMDMPVAALIAAGLPMGMVDPGAQARTDVLVGQDGRARAVRLISISIPIPN